MPRSKQSKQRALLTILNQVSQNLNKMNAANDGNKTDANLSLDLPGIDLNLGLSPSDLIPSFPSAPSNPQTPGSIRDVLSDLLNKLVDITTAFDTITGTLKAVKDDYAAVTENDGSTVLVPFDQIESVNQH